MSIVTIGDFKNYLQTVANAVSSGKMNVNDAEVKSVLQTIAAAVGEVSATPTANTLADRLKAVVDRLGEVSANPTANTALARLKALEGYLYGVEAALGAQADAEATGNGSLIAIVKRLRTILTDVWNDAANALNVQLTGSNVEPAVDFTLSRDVVVTAGSSATVYSNVDLSKYTHISGIFIMHSILWPHKIRVHWRNSRDSTAVVQELTEIGDAHKVFAPVSVITQRANISVKNEDTVDRRIATLDVYGHVRG
jgi:hypothetical protein